jgi:hypothetical protein
MNESRYWVRFKGNNELLTSSDFFDWDKKTELGYEEIKMDDLCLPLLMSRNKVIPYYKADIKSAYSDIDIEGKQAGQSSTKLAFIFGWGNSNHTGMFEYSYFFASQINRDSFGRWIYDGSGVKYDLSLTINREDGLFNRFWKEYDAWLRHSGYDVTCKLKLPEHEIFNLKMFETVIINNQPLLPVEIKYKLNKKDSIAECKFKTLRLYEPYNLVVEQGIPTYQNQMYYWAMSIVENPNVKNLGYPWEETSDYGNGFVTIDNVNYPTKQVELLPPTENQFQSQEKIIHTYQSVVTVDFGGGIGKRSYDVTTTVTYTPTRINYS